MTDQSIQRPLVLVMMPKKILVAANFRVQLVTPYHAHMFEHPGFLQPTKLASVAVLDNASAATHCNGAAAKDAAKKMFPNFSKASLKHVMAGLYV